MPRRRQNQTEPDASIDAPGIAVEHIPTSADVARRAGVSRATVSYVLNNVTTQHISAETCARVRQASEEMGYIPHAAARSLRAGQSTLVLMPLPTVPFGPLLDRYYQALAEHLGDLGYTVVLHTSRAASDVEAARGWAMLRPVGMIVETDHFSPEACEIMRTAGTRAILIAGSPQADPTPTLLLDNAAIGACAAEHLIARGNRRLMAVVPREEDFRPGGLDRLRGMQQVAVKHGLQIEQIDLAFDENDAAQVAAGLKQADQRLAIFAYNDEYAMLLMRALLDAEIHIPDQVALVGADDLPLCTLLRPRLTSVHLDALTQVPVVAATLHALIQSEATEVAPIELLRSQIVARESS